MQVASFVETRGRSWTNTQDTERPEAYKAPGLIGAAVHAFRAQLLRVMESPKSISQERLALSLLHVLAPSPENKIDRLDAVPDA